MVQVEPLNFVTPRIRELSSSPTLAVAKEAQALRAQGHSVVDFGPGEPDFDTPPHVRLAASNALEQGFTHYAPTRGMLDLRQAISDKLERENNLRYDPDIEVVVTPGAKQALLETIVTAVTTGDEVIIFDPGWASYDAIVRLAGATPIHVCLNDDFTINRERLFAAINTRTRVIIVGTPQNPTGHVLNGDELGILAQACERHNLLLVSDEIYERITYRGVALQSPASIPGMWERTVTINGLSKAYAMTGWRLGYVAAPRAFTEQLLKVHEHTVTAATTFAQVGGTVALNGSQTPIHDMVQAFARRRETVVDGLNRMPGVRCQAPEGAFYAFPDIRGTGMTGTELAHFLLGHGVAVTPGCGFGSEWDTHIRLSFAVSEDEIRLGLERMTDAVGSVQS